MSRGLQRPEEVHVSDLPRSRATERLEGAATVTRRGFLRHLPGLAALPSLTGKISTGRFVYAESFKGIAGGIVHHARQGYAVMLNGSKRMFENVTWLTRNNVTVNGSTEYLRVAR
jgi:hypothetical protein